MDRNKERIVRLIYLHMIGDISSAEEEELKDWIDRDAWNQKFFDEVSRGEDLVDVYRQYNQIDRKFALKRFENRMRGKRWVWRDVMKYAAMFVLPVTLALLVLWNGWEGRSGKECEQERIGPGGMKAVLKLADGQQVKLLRDSMQVIASGVAVQIVKTDSGIVYVKENALIEENSFNELETPRGGEYRLTLADGTMVYLNSETRLRYPVTFAKDRREVFLTGEAFFEVAKESERPFHVVMGDMEVKVYGTSFNINTYHSERVQTTLVSGRVGILVRSTGQEVLLAPNQMAEFDTYSKEVNVENVYTYNYVAWKFGEFVFDKESLGEIMERLNMWYDTKVFYENENLKKKRFTGIITRFADVSDVLSLIEATTSVHFRLKGNVIIVTE